MAEENTSFFGKLRDAYEARGFEVLEPYKDSTSWCSLGHSDREILGHLFVLRGEELFNINDPKAPDLLEKAMRISPNSYKILDLVVKVYMAQGLNNVRYISAALRALEEALPLYPCNFKLSHAYIQGAFGQRCPCRR